MAAVVGIGIFISFVVQSIMDYAAIPHLIGKTIQNIFFSMLQIFAWVTISFAIIDRYDDGKKKQPTKEWKISDLPKISNEQDRISRGETIFGIIVTTVLMIIFVFFPHLPAGYFRNTAGGIDKIPIFNLSVIESLISIVIDSLSLFSEILNLSLTLDAKYPCLFGFRINEKA